MPDSFTSRPLVSLGSLPHLACGFLHCWYRLLNAALGVDADVYDISVAAAIVLGTA